MAQICINEKVLSNVRGDDIAKVLNNMIDAELSKDIEDIDSAFVDECVDALLEYEKENNKLTVLVPIISSDKFLSRLAADKQIPFKSLKVFAKTAIIAAVVTGSTLTANAMVYSVTGVNVIETLAQRIEQRIDGIPDVNYSESIVDDFDGEEDPPYSETIVDDFDDEGTPDDGNSDNTADTGNNAKEENTQPDSEKDNADNNSSSDNNQGTTDTDSDKPVVIKVKENVTTAKPTVVKKDEKGRTLTSISADISSFKTDYIYGEAFSYDGLKLYCNYDDGSREPLKLSDCYYSKIHITEETADYTLTIIYNTCKLEIAITVRPDEDTRGSDIVSNGEFNYLLTDGGAYITEYKGDESDLVLNLANGNKIIAIGADVLADKNVKTVRADYVNKVFENAFKDCKSLEKCIMPNLKYISDSAFDGCEKLTDILYSSNLTYLGSSAFRNTAIKSAVIPESVTQIPDCLFENCAQLKNVEFKGKVNSIGKNAFADCIELEAVNGCADIKEVKSYAFYGDEIVTFDTFPKELQTVGDYAFYLCIKLNIGSLPQGVTSIGKSSFTYCAGLTELTIPKGITVIPYEAFRGCGAKTVTIPEGVEVIEDYALRSVKATELVLPDSLKSIGFEGIRSPQLRKIYFGRNIEAIADNAVYPSRSVMLYVYDESLAMSYAVNNSINYEIIGIGG